MTSEAKKEKDILEITKGENANLDGMEPRCPKCGNGSLELHHLHVCDKIYCLSCKTWYEIAFPADFAQFFRSPAPTPPLDVPSVEEIIKLLGNGWKGFKLGDMDDLMFVVGQIRLAIQKFYSLRRHIASPAPQPNSLMEKVVAFIESAIEKSSAEGSELCMTAEQLKTLLDAIKAASPAQPEKRDEWVSVDERTPELSGEYIVCFASGTISGNCHWNASTKAWGNNRDGSSWNITHWQPLPAPPQSGKEGQP